MRVEEEEDVQRRSSDYSQKLPYLGAPRDGVIHGGAAERQGHRFRGVAPHKPQLESSPSYLTFNITDPGAFNILAVRTV